MDETRLDKIEIKELEVYIPKKMFWDRSLLFLLHFLPEHVWRD